MKKVVSLALALVMMLGLCACGGGSAAPEEEDHSDAIRLAVQSEAAVECMFSYANVKNVLASVTNTDDNGAGTYDVNGYLTVIDAYGDRSKAKFDATVSVDEDGDADCDSFSMETPTRE